MSGHDAASLYERCKDIVADALARPADEREAFTRDACDGDDALFAEVVSLLAHSGTVAEVLDESPLRAGTFAGVAEPRDPPVPERIGHFRVHRRLATGGMGTVYEAEQENPRRRVALKLLRRDVFSPDLLTRFEREAAILGRLQHPCVAQVFESGVLETADGDVPYFSMEYVDGRQLVEHAHAESLSTRARLELFAQVCDGVEHAHERGVIHRDLKPDNVLVDGDGRPKVLDFGVARATRSDDSPQTLLTEHGQIVGTLPYMSPEQIAGESRAADVRSDVYALGVVLFELLSGRRPHELRHASITQAAQILREEEPTRLASLDTAWAGDLDTIVGKALEKDPTRRYASAAELAADVRRHLKHEPIHARPASRMYRARKFVRRHRGLTVGGLVALVALSVAAIVSLTFGLREAASADHARRVQYVAELTAAQSLLDRDPGRAVVILDGTLPELRGFEWHLLRALTDSVVARHGGDPIPAETEMWQGDLGRNTSVAWRRDGRPIGAVVRGDGVVLVDLISGEDIGSHRASTPLVRPQLSADGTTLVAQRVTGGLVAWDLEAAERLPDLDEASGGALWPMGLSADGRTVIHVPERRVVEAVDLRTGELLARRRFEDDGTDLVNVPYVATHDGLALMRRELTALDDPEPDAPLRLLQRDEKIDAFVHASAFDADGRWIALGTPNASVEIHDRRSDEVVAVLQGHHLGITALAFTRDGRHLVSASRLRELFTWDTTNWEVVRRDVTSEPIMELVVGPDGRLAAAGEDEVFLLGDPSRAQQTLPGHGDYVYSTTFSTDDELVASGGWDSRVRLWDAWTGAALADFEPTLEAEDVMHTIPQGVSFAAEDHVLAIAMSVDQRTFDPVTLERLGAPTPGRRPHLTLGAAHHPGSKTSMWTHGESAVVTHDGRSMLVFPRDGAALAVHDLGASDPSRAARRIDVAVDGMVTAVGVSRDGRIVALGDEHGALRLIDFATGDLLASASAHESDLYSIDFHPDGTRLATAGRDGSVTIWRLEPLELLLRLAVHDNYVHSVEFSDDGTRLVAGSGDSTITLFHALPTADRAERIAALDADRRAAAPLVDALLAEHENGTTVAEILRADTSLTPAERRAALYVLRTRLAAARRSSEASHRR